MDYILQINPYEELYHYGIKGQHWGERRFQNPDGSYTTAGKTRRNAFNRSLKNYRTGALQRAKTNAERAAKKIPSAQNKYKQARMQADKARSEYLKRDSEYRTTQNKLTREENKRVFRSAYKQRKLERKLDKQAYKLNRATANKNRFESKELTAKNRMIRTKDISNRANSRLAKKSRQYIDSYGQEEFDRVYSRFK